MSSIEPTYSAHLASDNSSEWDGQPKRRGPVCNPSARKKQRLCFQNCECECHWISSNHLKLFGGLLGTITTTQTGSPLNLPLCREQCGLLCTPRTSLTWYPPRQWPIDFVSILFTNGCRLFVSLSFPKVVPPDSEFPVAIRAGDLDRVQEQLRSGQASVADIVAPYGLTPLSLAILYGQGELCQLLIREGANLFAPDHTWAISDIYDFFVSFSLCSSSISARAVLQDSVRRCSSQEQLAALRMCMLEPGFRAFSFPRLHKSVLGLTTESLDILAPMSRLRINEIDITGRAALHWAVYNEDVSSVDTLIRCGSDPSIRDHEGVSPLHVAASLGSVTCMETLLRAGANPCSGDRLGLTPLHHAAAQGHEEAIRLLVTTGASWSIKSYVAEIPLAYAIYAGHSHAVEILLECGSSLEYEDQYGYTSILDATFTDSHQTLEALTRMARVGAKLFDGKTILHVAAANSDTKTMEILQNACLTGVDIDAVDNAGFTAIQYIRMRSDGEEFVEPFGALLLSVTPGVREPFEDLEEDNEEFVDVLEFQEDIVG